MERNIQRNMKVAVRVRPNSRRELESNQMTIVKVIDPKTLLFDPDEDDDEFFFHGTKQTHRDITKKTHKKLSMEFDQVFHADITNYDVFKECTKPLVHSVMNGYNCSVFVYGATGAGKTHTMLGNETSPGITYLTMQELFNQMNSLVDSRKFDIGISYLEVYNEQVMNLLTKSGPLKLREDASGVIVSGLALKPIYNAEELLSLLALGNHNRTQHPTDANAESSRSHAIFQVHIRMTEMKTDQKRTVKLSMIDLAGSERAASTKGLGLRFKEGASINKSLLALGNCINKLADGLSHIPYRDSNLTRILKDSLGGNCQTLMIANVSPSSLTYEDTYNTLKYASRAKKIRSTVHQNVLKTNMPKDYYVKKVCEQMDEIDKLKQINKNLEEQLLAGADKKPERIEVKAYHESELKSWYRKIDAIYSALMKSQEYYFGMKSKEKILQFRIKLRAYSEDAKKVLTLDNCKLNEEIGRFEASIDRFSKQIGQQKEDLARWHKNYVENLSDVQKLCTEIGNDKHSEILQMYMRSKESEIEISKQKINVTHITKVNSLYYVEFEQLRKIYLLALEVVQRNYYLFRAHKLIDTEFQQKLDKLSKMCNGHGIKFSDEKDTSSDYNLELTTFNFEDDKESETRKIILFGKRENCSDDETEDSNDKKRSRKLFKNDNINNDADNMGLKLLHNDDFQFKRPKTIANETVILSDLNGTFQIDNSSNSSQTDNKINKNRTELMNMLSEQNFNAANKALISKAVLKSNISRQNIIKTINVGINKENKKYIAGRIKKSPRPSPMHPLPTRLRRKSLTPIKNHGLVTEQNGFVRTNRTAFLRTKK